MRDEERVRKSEVRGKRQEVRTVKKLKINKKKRKK